MPGSEGTEPEPAAEGSAPAPNVRSDRLRLQNSEIRVSLDVLDEPASLTLSSLELTDFGIEDATMAAVSNRILDGIREAIQPLIQDKVEEEAKARVKEKAKEAVDEATDKAKEKLGDKLKGLLNR